MPQAAELARQKLRDAEAPISALSSFDIQEKPSLQSAMHSRSALALTLHALLLEGHSCPVRSGISSSERLLRRRAQSVMLPLPKASHFMVWQPSGSTSDVKAKEEQSQVGKCTFQEAAQQKPAF